MEGGVVGFSIDWLADLFVMFSSASLHHTHTPCVTNQPAGAAAAAGQGAAHGDLGGPRPPGGLARWVTD